MQEAIIIENDLATKALDICFELHRQLGPVLFESVYEELFHHEWIKTGILIKRQHHVPLIYNEIKIDCAFRADFIIDDKLILEFKSVDRLADIHHKQVLTYLKLTNLKLGLLINFNEVYLKNGVKRIVNKL